jgi:diguanylate cyclase
MSITTYLCVFGSGLAAGMLILFVARKIESGESLNVIGALRGMFSKLAKKIRRPAKEDVESQEDSVVPPRPVDPREQELYDSAQTIRNILLILTASIQQSDKAASDSSQVLGDVKSSIHTMGLPTDLTETQELLMKEIDRVISSNAALKGELTRSRAVLTEQQRQIEALRTEVRIDGLTKMANRTYFDEKLNEMIKLRKRYGDPFSLLMIDLDNFKAINDSYGHLAGDRILKGVALKIKASLRGSDFLARFGGDEYALILIKTDAAAATEVAWKLCEEVRGSRFLLNDTALTMTLSIGVAEAKVDDTEETLLERADAALYRRKQDGRNGASAADMP